MTSPLKLIPLLLAWSGIVAALARYSPGRRILLMMICASSFAGGVAGGYLLLTLFKGEIAYGAVKVAAGACFICLWVVSLTAFYRVTGSGGQSTPSEHEEPYVFTVTGLALLAGILAGAICVCRLAPQGAGAPLLPLIVLVVAGVLLAGYVIGVERFVPGTVAMTGETIFALVVSLLLFASSFSLQLDLFSPLSMKVMKFIHDFVHQFFESMLVPDHLFFRRDAWEYIGYLFGSGVGFWGGLLIWFAPVILICSAIRLERLPTVSHIRQGAQRRKLLAAFIRERRCRLIVPCFAMLILGAAVYNSRFPSIEYWDPKPISVTMNASGEIFIPKKGEIDLEDGKLHKYLIKHRGREARFMILSAPDGHLTVTLDACAICKPDGYGQAEGAVLCYYCKTLIPLETVGKPGGCNPVPVPLNAGADGVTLDAMTILNRWSETVTTTSRIKGGGK
jgi:FtrD-like iron-sulfur protein